MDESQPLPFPGKHPPAPVHALRPGRAPGIAALTAVFVVMAGSAATAIHMETGCNSTSMSPADVSEVDLAAVGGPLYYIEERGNPLGTDPPVPLSGLLLGDGTWIYEETNGVRGGQRGGPGFCWTDPPLPCIIASSDWIQDANCEHGPDKLVF